MTEVVIPLTKGQVARISAIDAERVASRKWYAFRSHAGIWYARAKINGRIESMHRFILGLPKGEGVVDHIDCDGLNNTRENIRVVTAQQNASRRASRRGAHMRGVSAHHRRNRWISLITCNGKRHYLGCFETEAEANAAYRRAGGDRREPAARRTDPSAARRGDPPAQGDLGGDASGGIVAGIRHQFAGQGSPGRVRNRYIEGHGREPEAHARTSLRKRPARCWAGSSRPAATSKPARFWRMPRRKTSPIPLLG